jgi:hypothetical protein
VKEFILNRIYSSQNKSLIKYLLVGVPGNDWLKDISRTSVFYMFTCTYLCSFVNICVCLDNFYFFTYRISITSYCPQWAISKYGKYKKKAWRFIYIYVLTLVWFKCLALYIVCLLRKHIYVYVFLTYCISGTQ